MTRLEEFASIYLSIVVGSGKKFGGKATNTVPAPRFVNMSRDNKSRRFLFGLSEAISLRLANMHVFSAVSCAALRVSFSERNISISPTDNIPRDVIVFTYKKVARKHVLL